MKPQRKPFFRSARAVSFGGVIVAICVAALIFHRHESRVKGQVQEGKRYTPELVVQAGHADTIKAVAFSPDGKLLASGSFDNTIKLWHVETARELRTLYGHSFRIHSVAFSPDGRIIASAGVGREIRLWDVSNGQQIKTLTGHTHDVNLVAFSPDGRTLASCSNDETLKLWDTQSGKEIQTIDTKQYEVESTFRPSTGKILAFSPAGDILAFAAHGSRTIVLWNLREGLLLKTLATTKHDVWPSGQGSFGGNINDLHSLAFMPDGKRIVSGTAVEIKVWDVGNGNVISTPVSYSFETGVGGIHHVALSPDGTIIAGVVYAGVPSETPIKLWRVEDGREIREMHKVKGRLHSLAFSPDGSTLATGGSDVSENHLVKTWNISNGKEIKSFGGYSAKTLDMSLSPNGQRLATLGEHNSVKMWDLAGGQTLKSFKTSYYNMDALAFSPDSTAFAVADYNKVEIRDSVNGQLRSKLIKSKRSWGPSGLLSFTPDGTMVTLAGKHSLSVWDVKTGDEIRSFERPEKYPDVMAIEPSGTLLLDGDLDGSVRMWEVGTGKQRSTSCGLPDRIASVAFSPNGKLLAASMPGHVKICDARTGNLVKELKTGRFWSVATVIFSPDSRTLAGISVRSTVIIWDFESGNEPRVFAGQEYHQWRNTLAFSPDGKTLFSTSVRRIKVWNIASGIEIASLVALGEDDWVVVTPDGRFDTNKNLDSIEGLHWVVPDDPLTPVPLDIFMRDYYEPGLLPRLLRCSAEDTCDKEFKPLPNIAELNRAQPKVRITNISLPDANRRVEVTVEAGKGSIPTEECQMKRCESGVYDLRLFRDGQIVGTHPSEGQAELIKHVSETADTTAEKQLWRRVSAVPLKKITGCVTGAAECATFTFIVELPRGKNTADIEFSAYAFNEDRVKSGTATWNKSNWTAQARAKLPKALPVRPRAYIVSVGVNSSQIPNWTLRYAVKDALETQKALVGRLNKQYETVPINLVSDFAESEKKPSEDATKEKIRAVLGILAGRQFTEDERQKNLSWQKLRKVSPDDAVFISISSHGYADPAGNFYLLPSDVKRSSLEQSLPDVKSMISADELSLWLRDIDAAEMVMIIDTCYAAASVSGGGFKPAPMGGRGLGQLAYDKQMRILTATREKDEALEVQKDIKQGLLTFALIQDGLNKGLADFEPRPDGKIWLSEWLNFAVHRVPLLFQKIENGEIKGFVLSKSVRFGSKNVNTRFLQTPVLFDLRRKKESDIELANQKH